MCLYGETRGSLSQAINNTMYKFDLDKFNVSDNDAEIILEMLLYENYKDVIEWIFKSNSGILYKKYDYDKQRMCWVISVWVEFTNNHEAIEYKLKWL